MPLQLGTASHQRSQLVSWDPDVYEQTVESRQRIQELLDQGFTVDEELDGEVSLIPPPRKQTDGVLRILSDKGDDIIVWDRTDKKQVKEAFEKFKGLMDKGYTAYATHTDGSRAHKIDTFDSGLQEIICGKGTEIVCVPKTRPG